jgi:hypothetical protein
MLRGNPRLAADHRQLCFMRRQDCASLGNCSCIALPWAFMPSTALVRAASAALAACQTLIGHRGYRPVRVVRRTKARAQSPPFCGSVRVRSREKGVRDNFHADVQGPVEPFVRVSPSTWLPASELWCGVSVPYRPKVAECRPALRLYFADDAHPIHSTTLLAPLPGRPGGTLRGRPQGDRMTRWRR